MKNLAASILVSILSLSISPSFADQGAEAVSGKPVNAAPVPGFEPAPHGARVFFANLKNGQKIPKKFLVKFGLSGMTISPAGKIVPKTGHHHLIIDGASIPAGQVVPTDATHLHFGKGQTETELELTPGKHKLTLQFANGVHLSYGPGVSDTVDVVVE